MLNYAEAHISRLLHTKTIELNHQGLNNLFQVIEVRRDNLPHMNSPKPVNLESASSSDRADEAAAAASNALKDPKKKKQGCCSIM